MQLTAEMLREAFRQTQREILSSEMPERYQARWERMAELLRSSGNKIQEKTMEPTWEKDREFLAGYFAQQASILEALYDSYKRAIQVYPKLQKDERFNLYVRGIAEAMANAEELAEYIRDGESLEWRS